MLCRVCPLGKLSAYEHKSIGLSMSWTGLRPNIVRNRMSEGGPKSRPFDVLFQEWAINHVRVLPSWTQIRLKVGPRLETGRSASYFIHRKQAQECLGSEAAAAPGTVITHMDAKGSIAFPKEPHSSHKSVSRYFESKDISKADSRT